jgi:hypothetical protein
MAVVVVGLAAVCAGEARAQVGGASVGRPKPLWAGLQGSVGNEKPAPRRSGPAAPLRGARRGGGVPEGSTAVEAERLFDRYALGEARTALQLQPGQLGPFAAAFDQLQATRRRVQRERQRLLNDLAVVSRGGAADETVVGERLRALEAFRARADQDLRAAISGIDGVLTVPQRARFRVFERRIERQKLELLARARRAARGDEPAPADPASQP